MLAPQRDDVTTLKGVDHNAAVILSDERGRSGSGRGGSSIGVVNEAGSTFIRSGRGPRGEREGGGEGKQSATIPAFAAE